MKDNKWAVVVGRFQPFHVEHERLFNAMRDKGFKKVVVMLGQQDSSKKDPFHFIHRANFFKNFLGKFCAEFAIAPMYNFDSDEKWANDVTSRIVNAAGPNAECTIFISKKKKDINENGYHYAEALGDNFPLEVVEVVDESINATDIRENFEENGWAAHPDMWKLMSLDCSGGPPNFEMEIAPSPWMRIKRSIREKQANFMFSSRRNRDSVAFVLENKNNYGFIIEGKPPIGDSRSISAFGGGFDKVGDDPYRIVRQEVAEEAGFSNDQIESIEYKGSYLATTQSDEVVHCFLVHVNSYKFCPQTTDEGEKENDPIWLPFNKVQIVADWKAQMIMRK